jgi:hypothetical protein
MRRVAAVTACGFALAACTMSMPSLDFFKSTPPTETLRIESEPPGADARTSQGQNCRTPCELTVPAGGDMAVSFALNGYQPLTVPVRTEQLGGPGNEARLQPNPVYGELQPAAPPRPAKKGPAAKRKTTVQRTPPAPAPGQGNAPDPNSAYPAGYPWPPAPQ